MRRELLQTQGASVAILRATDYRAIKQMSSSNYLHISAIETIILHIPNMVIILNRAMVILTIITNSVEVCCFQFVSDTRTKQMTSNNQSQYFKTGLKLFIFLTLVLEQFILRNSTSRNS